MPLEFEWLSPSVLLFEGGQYRFTPTEAEILRHLEKGRLTTRKQLWDYIYQLRPGDTPSENNISVIISHLRRRMLAYNIGLEIRTIGYSGYELHRKASL